MCKRDSVIEIVSTYEDVHSTRVDFFTVQAAVIPTNVFPAPQGRTMIPERARLDKMNTLHEL